MKKLHNILLVAGLLFTSNLLYGQSPTTNLNYNPGEQTSVAPVYQTSIQNEGPTLLLGVRFMPTITSLDYHKTSDRDIETSFVLGYGFGGLFGVNLSDHVGLQAEVIYSAISQKYKDDYDLEHEVQLSYINVPLMIVLNTNYSKPVNLNIAFGPQFGFNTGSKIETSKGAYGTDTVQAVLAVKPVDFGFAYGAGLDFGTADIKLSLGFRGVYGFLDISNNNKNITSNEYYVLERAHVKTYSGYIGVTFGF